MTSCHVAISCHVVTLETDPCVCPCQYSPTHVKDKNPCLCVKCPFQHFAPTHVASKTSKSGSKTQKSYQTKCHAPFSARKHVGGDMSNMSFHDVMSHHVVMSCHVVTLETDPCVCPCQCSPTHVKDQNPCLCVKCPFQHFSQTHVASRMSKSGSKTPEIRPNKVPRPLFCLQACRG